MDELDERLLHGLQLFICKPLSIIYLFQIAPLQFPHYIPLLEEESTGPSRTLAGVTVRPSRGVHPPSGRGAASRTDGSPVIADTFNLVLVQAITA